MDEKPIIAFRECTKRFGDKTVLDRVSFSVSDHALISILGRSGSGKTTLIRLLAGLEKPDSGTIIINGKTVTEDQHILIPPNQRQIGFIFQDLALFPHFSVYDNIAFGLKLNQPGKHKELTMKTLIAFNLTGLKDKYPNQLSGGQQQLVALARSWALNPEILLMDEPMANLDVKLKREIRDKVRELGKERRVTVLYITHDHREAMEISDRILLLSNGHIAFSGSPDEMRRSENPYVKEFIEY